MSRYISILLLLFLFSELNGQKQDSVKTGGIPAQQKDAIKKPAQLKQANDTVKVAGKTVKRTVPVRVQQLPDSVRFSSKVPMGKVIVNPVKIVTRKQGLIKKTAKKQRKSEKDNVYIEVYQLPYSLKKPPESQPFNSLKLFRLKSDLIVPPWIIAQRKAALEQKKLGNRQDTVRGPRILKQWNLSKDFSEEIPIEFDTVFSLFNRYRIADSYSPVNANLGNYGLPYYSINFFDRITDPDKYLYSHYSYFMHLSDNALFMNTQVPFTELKWINSGEKEIAEQTFRVRHSQNINRFLNFGLVYDIIFSLGQYSNQRAEDKTFTFYTSYTRSRYKLYFSLGLNGLFGQENGGITDKSKLDIKIANTRDIPVNLGSLNDASSFLKNRNFLVVQRFTFLGAIPDKDTIPVKRPVTAPLTGTFSHIFQLDYSRRMYRDKAPGSGFYDSIYINKSATFDSLSAKIIKNTFRVDFTTDESKFVRLGGGFGFRNECFWFGQIIPAPLPVVADTANWFRGNNVLLGRLSNQIGKNYRWLVNGELYFDRYRQGDFVLNGEMSKSVDLKKGKLEWLITGGINKRTPSFWYTQWGSNNFEWRFDAKKESRLDLGTRISYPARHADLKLNYAVINNYLDFDTLAMPSQDTSRISVLSLAVRKDFRIWKFHLEPDVIVQKSSNPEIIDLPQATVKVAAYIEHLFKFQKTNGRLNTQLGVDVTYHTLYHPYTYMPATGQFYRQDQSVAGNYPFVNAFLNIKLKRTRFFLMFDHLNYGMLKGDMLYNYDMVPLYPQTIRRFSFGLAWTFYN